MKGSRIIYLWKVITFNLYKLNSLYKINIKYYYSIVKTVSWVENN